MGSEKKEAQPRAFFSGGHQIADRSRDPEATVVLVGDGRLGQHPISAVMYIISFHKHSPSLKADDSYTPDFIFPQHCSTPLPMNCHDEDLATGILIARPLEEPTIATKLILSIRIASCIRRFFDAVNFSSSASYDLCLQIDQEIREVLRTSPSYLHAETSISHLPSFVASMRNYVRRCHLPPSGSSVHHADKKVF